MTVKSSQIADRHPLALTLTALTVISGMVDAISYLGLGHVFTANMTGNVVILGFAAARTPGFSVTGSLLSLAAFLVGSVLAGRTAIWFQQRPRPQWLRTTLGAEAVLQAIATVVAFTTTGSTYLLIVILAVAMGLRNGTVRKLGVPDMTTTVLTMTLTGLASDSTLAGGDNPRALRRLTAVASMLVGAFAGAMLLRHAGLDWALLAATILVTLAAVAYREP